MSGPAFGPTTRHPRPCVSCGPTTGKWAQGLNGLCRTCHTREHGYVSTSEREAEHVQAMRDERRGLTIRVPAPTRPDGSPIPKREICVNGQWFDVLFDGT